MKKVKPGDTVTIDSVAYRIGNGDSRAINYWLEFLKDGVSDEGVTIHLYTADGKGDNFFSPSKIKEALEKSQE